ncbi:hypothetical protein FN846DRAFT_913314 [Sphaerosporella brunnea]|uniref:Uncharacterized protein n=1 Tax=Sphaerosporella brunnea TaxID=1250544 RepID=A0A5J5EEM2_9PEZI|nr:hypothetical protein FN846DRAFT_913314 [Sphaerosporella brunnea]
MIEKARNPSFLEGSSARVDDAPDTQNRSQIAGSSLPQKPRRRSVNVPTICTIATTSHNAGKRMLAYQNDHRRLVSEKDILELKAKRVAADLHDRTDWQPHQPAIRRAFGRNSGLAGIAVKFMRCLIRRLDPIWDEKYPVVGHLNDPNEPLLIHYPSQPQAEPNVHLDSVNFEECDRMLAELSGGVDNLNSIVGEQQRLNGEVLRDRGEPVV